MQGSQAGPVTSPETSPEAAAACPSESYPPLRVSVQLSLQQAGLLPGLGNPCLGWDEAEHHEASGAHPQWPPSAFFSSATTILMW